MHSGSAIWALLLVLSLTWAPPVRATGDATGGLGSGGRAVGDISRETNETDRITIDLVAGPDLSLRLAAGFRASLALTDPNGAPVDLGLEPGGNLLVRAHPITTAGTYTLSVASADGSQGRYTLVAKQHWPRKQTVSGAGAERVDVPMPAASRLACVVRSARGQPEISGLEDPADTQLLAAPISTTSRVAKLPLTSTASAGTYDLAIDTVDHVSPWVAIVTRVTPPISATTVLTVTNGLDVVSYAADGVGAVFARRCGSCHGWPGSYDATRSYASRALGQIVSGRMPPEGPLPRNEIALIRAWISTGRAR